MEQEIPLEVHHLNGDNKDNDPNNLQLVCPNCHALTDFYRGKNINMQGYQRVEDEDFITALKESPNIRQALLSLGLSAKGANYEKAYRLIEENNIEHLKKQTLVPVQVRPWAPYLLKLTDRPLDYESSCPRSNRGGEAIWGSDGRGRQASLRNSCFGVWVRVPPSLP